MTDKSKISELDKRIQIAKRQMLSLEARKDFLKFVKYTMPDPSDPDNTELSMFKDAKTGRYYLYIKTKKQKGYLDMPKNIKLTA